jgi:uncharacterized protein DUF4238
LLWVYDRKLTTCKRLHPLSICFQHDLYAFPMPDGTVNQMVETDFLRHIDGASSIALRALPDILKQPTAEWFALIRNFVALQHLRVPVNKDLIKLHYEASASDVLEVAFGTAERAKASIARYEAKTGEKLAANAEEMFDAVTGGHIRPVVTEAAFLSHVVGQMTDNAKALGQLDARVLVSPPSFGFILSDNPVAVVPPGQDAAGFLSPGTFTFMPLTRTLCLRLGPRRSGIGPVEIDRETLRFINQNAAINSDRFVMGPSQTQLESVVRRSGTTEYDAAPKWKTVKRYDTDGILRVLIAQPRRFHHLIV